MLDNLKIAIVCDWLTVFAGAERVVYEIHELFPKAPIYTTLYNENKCQPFKNADVRESWLGKIPGARRFHRLLFPLMPRVFEGMDLSEYDIVISSSHSAAKGIITKPETLHISYCHSPMRYVWDHSHEYQQGQKRFKPLKFVYGPILHKIRMWDRIAADRVDFFIANSNYISDRIKKYYSRESVVLHPPVDLSAFLPAKEKGESYLAVGRLIPYKRFDLAVQACSDLGLDLNVVGTGPELNNLMKIAGPTVRFLGEVSESDLKEHYQRAKALIFPQLEDFGIVPLEAMASGTPVIAYKGGGALETVKDGQGGLFFEKQTVSSLKKAIKGFAQKDWPMNKTVESVEEFSLARFKNDFRHIVLKAWNDHKKMLG
jgi:glycosyltransferase involved in cell wall biosynthesis